MKGWKWLFKTLIAIAVIVVLLTISCTREYVVVIPVGCAQELPREVSLKEATDIFGVDIPIPSYLPRGYIISEITLTMDNPNVKHLSVIFLDVGREVIEIEKPQGCPIELDIRSGMPYTKMTPPQFKSVPLAGSYRGWLSQDTTTSTIYWNDPTSQDDPYFLAIALSTCKEVPIEELVSIARSIAVNARQRELEILEHKIIWQHDNRTRIHLYEYGTPLLVGRAISNYDYKIYEVTATITWYHTNPNHNKEYCVCREDALLPGEIWEFEIESSAAPFDDLEDYQVIVYGYRGVR